MKKSSPKAKVMASKTITKTVSKVAQSAPKMPHPKKVHHDHLNTTTSFNKILAVFVFGVFAVITFFLGMRHQESMTRLEQINAEIMKMNAPLSVPASGEAKPAMELKDSMMKKY